MVLLTEFPLIMINDGEETRIFHDSIFLGNFRTNIKMYDTEKP